jgi:hypothetical protein
MIRYNGKIPTIKYTDESALFKEQDPGDVHDGARTTCFPPFPGE